MEGYVLPSDTTLEKSFILYGCDMRNRHINIQGVKKGFPAVKRYSTHLNEQKFPLNICPESSACCDMCDIRVISTANAPCGSHTFQHNFQLFVAQKCVLHRKFLVSLESPGRHSLLIAVMPLSY
jgi:hypothetical protein